MPKPKYHINDFSFSELKKKVSNIAGFPIWTKPDCAKLSDLIYHSTTEYLSETTLYRLFIQTTENKPYQHTLDVLSKYCGFIDWNDFEIRNNQIEEFELSYGKIFSKGVQFDSLLKICVHNNELKSLYNFSEQIPLDLDVEMKHRLGFEFYEALRSNPNDNDKFYKNFYTLPIIREVLFEMMADPEFSLKGYEKGIKYYLKAANPENGIKELQDFIFAHSILFRHYFLNSRTDQALETGRILFEMYTTDDETLMDFHIFPRSRYFSYKIWYLHLLNLEKEKTDYIHEVLYNCEQNLPLWDRFEQRVVFYNLSEVASYCTLFKGFEERLKQIFHSELSMLPEKVKKKSLSGILPYLQENGLLVRSYLNNR